MTCSVEGCGAKHWCKGFCTKHFQRWRRHGSPLIQETDTGRKGAQAGYWMAHLKVKNLHGAASGHLCVQCDGPARQWAYDHCAPDEKYDPRFGAYSLTPEHYMPMCVPCHKRMDLGV